MSQGFFRKLLFLIFTRKNMRILLFFLLISLLQACTRTSQNSQQTDPDPVDKTENPTNINFGEEIFKAIGNEPSWVLSMDGQRQLSFKSIDDHQISLTNSVSEITRMSDGNAIRLQTKSDGKFNITLLADNCSDNMSGKKFGQTVQVMIQTPEMENPVLYKGCGTYKGSYKVNGKWTLVSVDGNAIPKMKETETPHLDIQLLEGKIYGYSGCNYMNGTVNMQNERLAFGPIAATKKACKDNTTENAMIQTLNSSKQKFAIDDKTQKLIMKSEQHTLIFEPAK